MLTLALSAVIGTAGVTGASHSEGNGPKDDFVTGTATRTAVVPGTQSETRVTMSVSAHSSASGEHAHGRFFIKRTTDPPVPGRPDLDYSGTVTCLTVIGNQAIVGGMITRDKLDLPSNPIEGTGWLGVYVDNDQVSGADDQSNSAPGRAAPGNVCPTFVPFPTAPFQQGNYVVHERTT